MRKTPPLGRSKAFFGITPRPLATETFRSGQSTQRWSEQNDDGLSTEAKEGKLQISGVFDLATKLAKLICHRFDNTLPAIRDRDLHFATNALRLAHIQELSRDDEAIALRLRF